LANRLATQRDVSVGLLSHDTSNIADFYREMGDIFGVTLRPHNRWGGFKVLCERWVAVPMWLEDADNELSDQFRLILDELRVELVALDQMIVSCDTRIAQWTKEDAVACRLMTLRGPSHGQRVVYCAWGRFRFKKWR
jgi:hypothetical protein